MGKEYIKTVCCHPAYLTYMQSTSWEILDWINEAQAGIKIAGRNINNLRYADDTTLMAESRVNEEPHDESERGEWKAGLKFNIQKTKIMASGPITS